MKGFIYWLSDKLFSEKVNNWICGVGLVLTIGYFFIRTIIEFI